MAEIHQLFADTTVNGRSGCRWELTAGECLALAAHRIARIGLHEVAAPYCRVRVQPAGSFLLACHAGVGRMLLEGRWQDIRAGTVAMAPPRVLNAFHALPRQRWAFTWLRFDEPPAVHPLIGAAAPVRVRGDVRALLRIFEGLRAEAGGRRDLRALHHWCELLMLQLEVLVRPWRSHPRLRRLWELVDQDLAAPWALTDLARACACSTEQLRRLCQRELGRSPRQQVTYLRMRRAQEWMERSADKMQYIAERVGYEDATAFSRAFKRMIGVAPSAFRRPPLPG